MCHFEAVRPLEASCSVAELSPLAEPLEEPLEEEAWLSAAELNRGLPNEHFRTAKRLRKSVT